MSDLSNIEKRRFEKLFGIGSGYVLNFSNRTFEEFVIDSAGKSIYDAKYNNASGSKANRLRAFWTAEPNYVVGKLLGELLQYTVELGVTSGDGQVLKSCRQTVQRLLQSAPVPEIEAITPNTTEKDFAILAKSVREAIEKNEPESGLDRLHTFVVKYMHVLCQKHGITTDKDKPLHGLVGEYVKKLKEKGHIESEMIERILKSSISTLEAFNRVRNDYSFAHDNQFLNYDESLFIFNHVASAVRFVKALEQRISLTEKQNVSTVEQGDEIPF
ncbi:MAG TPA: abortive infection family protein [Thermodesulfobacteriota bacterium]|nr:abortive infection family protein [Thermodesulfobacteriota bacterium]